MKAKIINRIVITGKVIHGDHYGRRLGFPTANLDRRQYLKDKLNVRFGVWAGEAEYGGKKYRAAIVIGPKDKNGLTKLEAHLVKFKGQLYGKKIRIVLYKYIRPFKKYSTEAQLIKQIAADVKKINSIKL